MKAVGEGKALELELSQPQRYDALNALQSWEVFNRALNAVNMDYVSFFPADKARRFPFFLPEHIDNKPGKHDGRIVRSIALSSN